MTQPLLAVVSSTQVALFGLLIILIFLVIFALCIFGVWLNKKRNQGCPSPYSRLPLRRASELSYSSKEKILRYLYNMHQYDNRIFEFRWSALCRETGRVFTNAITWYDTIKVDWTFLQKRLPGQYVSWGSLTGEQQDIVRNAHDNLDAFQTEFSSPIPQPSVIEAKYAFTKPGPLYVDIQTNILLGWQIVPDTELEVLIVQKPLILIYPSNDRY